MVNSSSSLLRGNANSHAAMDSTLTFNQDLADLIIHGLKRLLSHQGARL